MEAAARHSVMLLKHPCHMTRRWSDAPQHLLPACLRAGIDASRRSMNADLAAFPFRTVVFDLDGTLIDSADDVGAAVNRVLADHGLAPIDAQAQRALMGEGGRMRTRQAFAMGGVTLDEADLGARVRDFVSYYAENPVARTRPYPGVPAALQRLADIGVRMGVCTNKYEESARDVLARLGLMPPIEDAAGADSFDVRKPHPGHILKLLARM